MFTDIETTEKTLGNPLPMLRDMLEALVGNMAMDDPHRVEAENILGMAEAALHPDEGE